MSCFVYAQVEIDKSLQLTGSGLDSEIQGIKSVTDSLDAVNVKSIQNGSLLYSAAQGANDTFLVSLNPAISGLQAGMVIHFLSNQDISGPAAFNLQSLGAFPIKKNFNVDLGASDIQNGQMVSLIFDGSNWQMLSQISSGGSSSVGGSGGSISNTLIYTVTGF